MFWKFNKVAIFVTFLLLFKMQKTFIQLSYIYIDIDLLELGIN